LISWKLRNSRALTSVLCYILRVLHPPENPIYKT
jgi:hypothetical protein